MPSNKRTSGQLGPAAAESPSKRRAPSELPIDTRPFVAGLRKAASHFSRVDDEGFPEMPREGELLKSADIPLSRKVVAGITNLVNQAGARIPRSAPTVPINWMECVKSGLLRPETILVAAHYLDRVAEKLQSLPPARRPSADALANVTAAALLLADKSHGPNHLGHAIHSTFREPELDPVTEEPVLRNGRPKMIYRSPEHERSARDLIAAETVAFHLLDNNTTVHPAHFSHQIDRLEDLLRTTP